MTDTTKQEQIDTLVKEIEDEMENNKTFNNKKHLALLSLDSDKAFEVFEKAMISHVAFVM